jgi:hypothetical protein
MIALLRRSQMNIDKIWELFNNETDYDGEEETYFRSIVTTNGKGTYRVQESRGDLQVTFLGEVTIEEQMDKILSEVDNEEKKEIIECWADCNDAYNETTDNEHVKMFFESDESMLLQIK